MSIERTSSKDIHKKVEAIRKEADKKALSLNKAQFVQKSTEDLLLKINNFIVQQGHTTPELNQDISTLEASYHKIAQVRGETKASRLFFV